MVCVKTFLLIAMVHVLSMSTEEINRCMTENDEECQLPFSFGGKTFSSCMLWNKNGSRASVCMTKINSTTHVHLKYPISTNFAKLKFCSKECVVEETVCSECVFPFVYQGKTYHSCIKWHEKAPPYPRWCPTAVDLNNNFIDGDRHWGHCSDDCKASADYTKIHKTVCKECILPFEYRGKRYNSCINSYGESNANSALWCPIALDSNNEFKDGDRHWEYCSDPCPGTNITMILLLCLASVIFIVLMVLSFWWRRNRHKININLDSDHFEFRKM